MAKFLWFMPAFFWIQIIGCSPLVKVPKVEPELELPESFSLSGNKEIKQKWWKHFPDQTLWTLVERAFKYSPTLKAARAKLLQARALALKSGVSLYPEVSGSIKGGPGYNYDLGNNSGSSFQTFSLAFNASYEVDLWGKNSYLRQAAAHNVKAARHLVKASALTLSGEIVSVWYQLASLQEQVVLLQSQVKLNESYLKSLILHYKQGADNSTEILQQSKTVQSLKSELLKKLDEIIIQKNRLALYIGILPNNLKAELPDKLPQLPQLPKTGIPLEVIKNRPDLRAAWLEIMAQNARVASALANRFPRLSITAELSSNTNKIKDVFKNWLVNLLGNLTAPLFDAGNLKAEQLKEKAILEEKLANYQNVALKAVIDIETYLQREKLQKNYIVNLKKQIDLSEKVLERLKYRYHKGVLEFSIYLSTKIGFQNLQLNFINAKSDLIQIRIGLLKSLAGGFPASNSKQEANKDEQ
ncbi:MAG: TolC family protein [Deltaproteobacteria bacterium]|jgi:NodT family efflux transporter outer membrane factor (OMF) lipoprotein|nr:TolC family protein [Deltaproteobacteria bacterium]